MIRQLELPEDGILDTLDNRNEVSSLTGHADYCQHSRLQIAQRIVSDPTTTFYFEASDDQIRYYGIRSGSIIVVDRSITAKSGDLVVCYLDSEWLTRRLEINDDSSFLCINDTMEGRINITGKDITEIGVVTWTCRPHQRVN